MLSQADQQLLSCKVAGQDLRILWKRSTRRKHLRLQVEIGGQVILHSPNYCSKRQAIEAVQHHADWLLRCKEKLEDPRYLEDLPRELQYINGEEHYYRGKLYPLQLVYHNGQKRPRKRVKLLNQSIQVQLDCEAAEDLELFGDTAALSDYCDPESREKLKYHLQEWYRHQARKVFNEELAAVASHCPWLKHYPCPPRPRLRYMKAQWGNCTQSGVVTLNIHLIKAKDELLRYVIAHELCHIAEFRHSKRFYMLLSRIYPNWKEARQELAKIGPHLLNS